MSLRSRLFSAYLSKIQINKIIQVLTYSDSFIWGSYYMVNAIVAVYLKEKLQINPIQTIATGVSVYMVSRSLFQIPFAQYMDKHDTFIDEAVAVFLSGIIMGISFFLYIFIQTAWHLFFVQALFGFGVAINLPAWRKTFARFVDHDHEGTQYGIYDLIYTLFSAALITLGGFIVNQSGNFNLFFIFASFLCFTGGTITLLLLKSHQITS